MVLLYGADTVKASRIISLSGPAVVSYKARSKRIDISLSPLLFQNERDTIKILTHELIHRDFYDLERRGVLVKGEAESVNICFDKFDMGDYSGIWLDSNIDMCPSFLEKFKAFIGYEKVRR